MTFSNNTSINTCTLPSLWKPTVITLRSLGHPIAASIRDLRPVGRHVRAGGVARDVRAGPGHLHAAAASARRRFSVRGIGRGKADGRSCRCWCFRTGVLERVQIWRLDAFGATSTLMDFAQQANYGSFCRMLFLLDIQMQLASIGWAILLRPFCSLLVGGFRP